MYEKDGEKYFVVDSHLHFWDASPENWVKGQEQYAKGWIECFHAYQGLGPAETHWTLEHFQKYSSRGLREGRLRGRPRRRGDLPVDVPEGVVHRAASTTSSTTRRCWTRFPGKLIVNGRWDPRDGEAGLQQLEADHANVRHPGRQALHGRVEGRLARLEARPIPRPCPFLEKCAELGIKNIHVHKGPTIWPLDKDAFDVSDVDHVATDFPELNFIVEHVGLPRIEDFCFMATQEPNVYAGLRSSSAASCTPARASSPRSWASCCSGSARTRCCSARDYAHLGAEVAGRGLRRLGLSRRRRVLRLPALDDRRPRRRSSASTRPSSTASRCRRSCSCRPRRTAPRRLARTPSSSRAPRDAWRTRVLAALGTVYDPELDEPITTLGFVGVVRRVRRRRRRGAPAPAHAAVRAELRLPDGRRRPRGGAAGCRRCARVSVVLEDHYTGEEINAAVGARRRLRRRVPRRDRRATWTRCASCSSARRWSPARRGCARRCWRRARRRRQVVALRVADLPADRATRARCVELRARARAAARPGRRRRWSAGDGSAADRRRTCRLAAPRAAGRA